MRILGLDLGSKTLGVAVSDKTEMIASVPSCNQMDGGHHAVSKG